MSQNNNQKNEKIFDRDYQMLNYFQEEFIYRHKHFWNIVIKSFLLTITITIIPIVSEIFGLTFNDIISNFLLVFPAMGTALAIVSFLLLLDEGKKMEAVNIAKYRINKKMDVKYQYYFYNKFSKNEFRDRKSDKKKCSLAKSLAILLLIIELTIITIVLIMLLNNMFEISTVAIQETGV